MCARRPTLSAETAARAPRVAEIQGLYGPFVFAEKLLQKIWLRGDFDQARARTVDGRAVRIGAPGRWNLLGGPDFAAARLTIGEMREMTGDVELHLHAVDWAAHGHARDDAYAGVVLHVVLFPPPAGYVTRAGDGHEIPVLALLPLLHHDLEEYAAEEAVETMANRPASFVLEELGALAPEELASCLERHARERWRQKVHYARLRVQRLGWEGACHHTALEILGYRFNRAPMLRLAEARPLSVWTRGAMEVEEIYRAEATGWSVQGVRPANHPRTRLKQYAAWVTACPDWPERLGRAVKWLPAPAADAGVGAIRRRLGVAALRERLGGEIAGGALGGTRLDTMICDGWLPLLAAQAGVDQQALWRIWLVGDVPPMVPKTLRALGVWHGYHRPAAQGQAQGLLGWMIERERPPVAARGRGA